MDCSTSGLPVFHCLPKFSQTHVHWVGDAIQTSHPLSPSSSPALDLSQHQGLFQWVSSSHQELNNHLLNKLGNRNCQRDRSAWVGEVGSLQRKMNFRVLQPRALRPTINNAVRDIWWRLGCGSLWSEDWVSLCTRIQKKLSALKSLYSYSFLEWRTFTHCINFEESLILTQKLMNRLWNLDILQLTNAKNKTVVSGGYLFLTLHFSTQAPRWFVYVCIFSPSKRTGTFVKLGHPSSGFNSEGAT